MFLACDCKTGTSASHVCDSEGKCRCNETYSGDKCSECSPGYFGYPSCQRKLLKYSLFLNLIVVFILMCSM